VTSPRVESWREVVGHEGRYDVSDQGRVRSHTRPSRPNYLMAISAHHLTGYLFVKLYSEAGQKPNVFVHQLVAEAFIGPRPAGEQVRHLDGNKLNNASTNLAYGSRSQNELDKLRHGTNPNARKTHCPKGHPYSEANTIYRRNRTSRTCRTCHMASIRRTRERAS